MIDENECILDLIPSTIFTKMVNFNLDFNNACSLLLAIKCLTSINNFNLITVGDYF